LIQLGPATAAEHADSASPRAGEEVAAGNLGEFEVDVVAGVDRPADAVIAAPDAGRAADGPAATRDVRAIDVELELVLSQE
jgi:hypothetical protein